MRYLIRNFPTFTIFFGFFLSLSTRQKLESLTSSWDSSMSHDYYISNRRKKEKKKSLVIFSESCLNKLDSWIFSFMLLEIRSNIWPSSHFTIMKASNSFLWLSPFRRDSLSTMPSEESNFVHSYRFLQLLAVVLNWAWNVNMIAAAVAFNHQYTLAYTTFSFGF